MIIVDAQAPSIPGSLCERSNPTIEFYHLYLTEQDFGKTNYFDGIEKMLTVDSIRAYGNKVFILYAYLLLDVYIFTILLLIDFGKFCLAI